jgi:methyl-accepting chemotaxis protein
MRFSNLNVGTRLSLGFGLLLAILLAIGGISWMRLAQLHHVVSHLVSDDWEKARLAMEVEIRTRDSAMKTGRILMAGSDVAAIETLKSQIAENSKANSAAIEKLNAMVVDPEPRALLTEAAAAREKYNASRGRVNELAKDAKTREQALARYRTETVALLEAYVQPFDKLEDLQQKEFNDTAEQSQATYASARNTIIVVGAAAMVLVIVLALFLSRGIVGPLQQAMTVAERIRDGKLDNAIDSGGEDETGRLLDTLGVMQDALRARDQKDADYRGQIAAIGRAQAVIEFNMDGTVREINDNFARVMGYASADVVGKHHSLFAEPAFANSSEYRAFWAKLNRGESEIGTYKRIAKGGREVWLQASYNPIPDASGKPFKVVEYASDVTEATARNVDSAGQLSAIDRSQGVIEFDMDGTVRKANENFLRVMGYSQGEVVGRHHSMFVDSAVAGSAEYRAFWAKLNRGEPDVANYKRIAKGGREVWIQASYNPIPDNNGRPFKVVKYASEVTAAMQAQRELQAAVHQTQDAVKYAIDGDLTHRIPMEGKTGDLELLCRGVNSLLESTTELVKSVKVASGEVQVGAQEISRGNINLSQRTEEQASSLEETASSMEQMTATVRQTADNAAQANQLALNARQQAEKGGSVVSSAVTAMGAINDASRKIADIIGVIDEIAFQTNLLALNAAVEAARAGEQGRGFAVVATEVRSLAGRSATAAKEIKALIQDSVAKVDEGSKLVDESGKMLDEIVQAVKKVTDIVAEIAAASREQSAGIDQVNKSVMAMDSTTQQNAALVEQAAAASEAIVEQAKELNIMVERYNVGALEMRVRAPKESESREERRSKDRPWSKSPMAAGNAAAPSAPRKAASGSDAEWNEF